MVVSYTAALRENASVALAITNGARVMLSTPPAMTNSASPARIARAALPTASSPEPHKRLMVEPGTVGGKPANRVAMRATLRLSSPAWLAQPNRQSSTASQSTAGFGTMSARSGWAAISSGRMAESTPP